MSDRPKPCPREEVAYQRVGTGLVIGSGTSLARSGPASLFISYVVMGTVCCGVMVRFGRPECYLSTYSADSLLDGPR